MTWFRPVVSGAVALFRWRRVEQDLDEELRAYLEASIDARMRDGLSRNDATLAARRALGSVDAVKDHTRDAGWEAGLESVWRDVRYAVRALRQAPGFSAVAVIILSVGIGATTAVFQLADAIRLRPLPVAHPRGARGIRMADPTRGRMGKFAGRRPLFTYALWEEFRQRQHAFAGVLAWSAYPVNLSARGEARFVQGVWVSGDYFRVLGVVPHLGRVFSSSDDRPGCGSPGAVLGYAFWQRQYGADPRIVGQTVSLNGHPFEVIGVASRGFVGLEVGRTFDVAAPLCAEVALSLVLVVTAVLFARTLHNLITLDSGFEPDRMTTVAVDYQRANTPPASRLELQQRLLHAVRSLPSVESAASVRMVPLSGEAWTGHVAIEGVRHQTQAYFNVVSPGFFRTIGSRVIAGRDFSTADSHGSPLVAVVNELFARKLLGTRNPVGLTFELPGSPAAPHRTFQIVGLVPNTKYTGLRDPFEPIAFFPVSQDPQPLEYVNLMVRAAAPSIALTRSLSEAIRRTELDAAVFVVPFSVQISDPLVRERLLAMLSGFFAGIGRCSRCWGCTPWWRTV
jgi:MacB-like periplasmic core domain